MKWIRGNLRYWHRCHSRFQMLQSYSCLCILLNYSCSCSCTEHADRRQSQLLQWCPLPHQWQLWICPQAWYPSSGGALQPHWAYRQVEVKLIWCGILYTKLLYTVQFNWRLCLHLRANFYIFYNWYLCYPSHSGYDSCKLSCQCWVGCHLDGEVTWYLGILEETYFLHCVHLRVLSGCLTKLFSKKFKYFYLFPLFYLVKHIILLCDMTSNMAQYVSGGFLYT